MGNALGEMGNALGEMGNALGEMGNALGEMGNALGEMGNALGEMATPSESGNAVTNNLEQIGLAFPKYEIAGGQSKNWRIGTLKSGRASGRVNSSSAVNRRAIAFAGYTIIDSVSGSSTHTTRTPAVRYSPTLAVIAAHRSEGERTSNTNSGAGQYPLGSGPRGTRE
jgi:histone-lysine N-methyltransferase SETD2